MSAKVSVVAFVTMAAVACSTPQSTGKAVSPHEPDKQFAPSSYEFLSATGATMTKPDALKLLRDSQVVCVGETHSVKAHHWAQLQVVEKLATGANVAIGLEMIERQFQSIVDDFNTGKINLETLGKRLEWKKRWGFDYDFYSPMLAFVRRQKGPVLALNAARDQVRIVGKEGVGGVSDEVRKAWPPIDLEKKKHREWFDRVMSAMASRHGSGEGHGNSHAINSDNVYAAQVVWDTVMAAEVAKWLRLHKDGQVIVIAGNGHCHNLGIPLRLAEQGIQTTSVQPIVGEAADGVASAVEEGLFDLLMVLK